MKKHLLIVFAAVLCLGVSSCKTDEIFGRIDDLQSQIDALSSDKIATIDNQIKSINTTIDQLGATDNALKALIESLTASQSALADELRAKDAAIEAKIAELKNYVDEAQNGTKDWANATFATIAQFNSLSDEVAALKAAFATASEDVKKLGADLAKQIADVQASIASLETSMKSWVNEQLAKYYTIAEIDAKIAAIETSLTNMTEAEAADIKAVKADLEAAKEQITEAYTAAIEKAINENNGVIDSKIAAAIATVNANVDNKIAEVEKKIADLEKRVADLEDKVSGLTREFDIVFDHVDFAISPGFVTIVNYKVVGATENTIVKTFVEGNFYIMSQEFGKVEDEYVGQVSVSAWSDGAAGQLYFLVGDNDKTILRVVDFEKGEVSLSTNAIVFPIEGGSETVELETNMYGETYSSDDWLSVTVEPKTKTMRNEVITITAQPNEVENDWRHGEVIVLGGCSVISVIQQAPLAKVEVAVPGTLSSVYPTDLANSVVGVAFSGEFNDDDWAYLQANFKNLKIADFSALKNTTIPEYQFQGNYVIQEITLPSGLVEVPNYFANNAQALTKIDIPESVKVIGERAFYSCSLLENINIPAGVEEIKDIAYGNCNALKTVSLPDGLTTLGSRVFYNCSLLEKFSGKVATEDGRAIVIDNVLKAVAPYELESYTVPAGVSSIDQYVFYGCTALKEVKLPESLQSIGLAAFRVCTSLQSIEIPSGVTTIDTYTFYGCTALKEVKLSEALKTIGDYAFRNCSALKNIEIPSSVVSLGMYSLAYCTSLAEVKLAEGLQTIGDYAFYRSSTVLSITIPSTVTSVGRNCFQNCLAMSSLTCLATVPPTCGANIFSGVSPVPSIYVPVESVAAYQATSGWSTYKTYIKAIPAE